jgi:toxin-antitoxin system PIN domain toxin
LVTRFLLDVNLIVAMHLPGSESFTRVQRWFTEIGSRHFATCAITQAGFVRVCTQLAVKDRAIDITEAKASLLRLTAFSGHTYWPMDISYLDATEPFEVRMQDYRQITDAFLLGLAIHHKGKLATLDRAIVHLAGPEFADHVELIS